MTLNVFIFQFQHYGGPNGGDDHQWSNGAFGPHNPAAAAAFPGNNNAYYLQVRQHFILRKSLNVALGPEFGAGIVFHFARGLAMTELGAMHLYELPDIIITDRQLSSEGLSGLILGQAQIKIIINRNNKLLKSQNISQELLQDIFAGKYNQWQIIHREPGSTIRQTLERYYLNNTPVSLNAIAVNSHAEMQSAIQSINTSIGYTTQENYQDYSRQLNILDQSGEILEPPVFTIYIYWLKNSSNQYISEFQEFMSQDSAKYILRRRGFN